MVVVKLILGLSVKVVNVASPTNVKPLMCALPYGVVTTTSPVEPCPTTEYIDPSERTPNDAAGVPPKVTDVAFVKLNPYMPTEFPSLAVVLERLVIMGGSR